MILNANWMKFWIFLIVLLLGKVFTSDVYRKCEGGCRKEGIDNELETRKEFNFYDFIPKITIFPNGNNIFKVYEKFKRVYKSVVYFIVSYFDEISCKI